jgi:hypothetical protein
MFSKGGRIDLLYHSILYWQLLSPLCMDETTVAFTGLPTTLENIISANPSEQ